ARALPPDPGADRPRRPHQERANAELGLSTSGMKSRVQRGRRMLREEATRSRAVARGGGSC
ncbi:MAG: hypothetical protein L0H64_03500, partial [Pseudonocardia sp.]|nr:hypothetical protein [Pseudonocardia sp.]